MRMSSSRHIAPAAVVLLVQLLAPLSAALADADVGPPGCQPARSALSVLGASVAQSLGPAAHGASVVVIELKSDRDLPAAAALRERIQTTVALALGSGARPAARREPGKSRVELSVEKTGGVLRVTAELRRPTGIWQRLRHRKPPSEQHAFVEVALDAELRALIPPPPLVVGRTLKLKAPERGIVALACGPLRSDGAQELALVTRGHVRVGSIAGGAFVERKKAAWSSLSAVAPTPLREPIASAEITAGGRLRVGLTDRRDGLELSPELAVIERFEGLLPVPGGGCLPRSELGVSSQLGPCTAPTAAAHAPAVTFDAVAGSAPGALGRELATGRLLDGQSGLAPPALRVGAQLGLGDADSDGAPELLYANDTLEGSKDRLTLITLQGKSSITRFELPAPAITAVTICAKREGPGMATIVVAAADELWVLR